MNILDLKYLLGGLTEWSIVLYLALFCSHFGDFSFLVLKKTPLVWHMPSGSPCGTIPESATSSLALLTGMKPSHIKPVLYPLSYSHSPSPPSIRKPRFRESKGQVLKVIDNRNLEISLLYSFLPPTHKEPTGPSTESWAFQGLPCHHAGCSLEPSLTLAVLLCLAVPARSPFWLSLGTPLQRPAVLALGVLLIL